MGKADDQDSKDEFQIYLERRITHQEVRSEKLKQYSQTDQSKLNSDQISALLGRDKLSGSLEELKSLELHYRKIKAQNISDQKSRNAQHFELISSFLHLMTIQFQICQDSNIINNISKDESAALAKLLYLFYSGGEGGGSAIAKFVEGSNENVLEGGTTFARLKEIVLDQSSYRISRRINNNKKAATQQLANRSNEKKGIPNGNSNIPPKEIQAGAQSNSQNLRLNNVNGGRSKIKQVPNSGNATQIQNSGDTPILTPPTTLDSVGRNQDKEKSQNIAPTILAVQELPKANGIPDKTNNSNFQVVTGKKDNKKRQVNKQKSAKKNIVKSK